VNAADGTGRRGFPYVLSVTFPTFRLFLREEREKLIFHEVAWDLDREGCDAVSE
jgi:hypothetical protein